MGSIHELRLVHWIHEPGNPWGETPAATDVAFLEKSLWGMLSNVPARRAVSPRPRVSPVSTRSGLRWVNGARYGSALPGWQHPHPRRPGTRRPGRVAGPARRPHPGDPPLPAWKEEPSRNRPCTGERPVKEAGRQSRAGIWTPGSLRKVSFSGAFPVAGRTVLGAR